MQNIVIIVVVIIIIIVVVVVVIIVIVIVIIIIIEWSHVDFYRQISFIFEYGVNKAPHTSRTFRTILLVCIKTIFVIQ